MEMGASQGVRVGKTRQSSEPLRKSNLTPGLVIPARLASNPRRNPTENYGTRQTAVCEENGSIAVRGAWARQRQHIAEFE